MAPDRGLKACPIQLDHIRVHDEHRRLTKVENDRIRPDSTVDSLSEYTYAHDAVGTFVYDDHSNVTQESQELFELTALDMDYEYDQAGNRTELDYPLGGFGSNTLTYFVDDMNRVETVKRDRGHGSEYLIEYDYTGGVLTNRRLYTDYGTSKDSCPVYLDMALHCDEFGRNDAIANTVSTGDWSGRRLTDFGYTYDDAGNRTQVKVDNPSGGDYTYNYVDNKYMREEVDYGYDDLNRVTSADWSFGDEDFAYDLLGNRSSFKNVDGYTTNYANNAVNEYTKIGNPLPGTPNIVHSDRGNLLADEDGYGYVYDEENRLVTIFDDDDADGEQDGGEATLASFAYDALGRRIEIDGYLGDGSASITGTRRLYYDGQNVIAEFDDGGTPALRNYWVHGAGYIDERAMMYNREADQDVYYFLKDLYTVAGLVNRQGHEVERYTYDTYGNVTIWAIPIGDVNYDGTANLTDRGIVAANIDEDPCEVGPIYDLDGDGDIDTADRNLIVGTTPMANIPHSAYGNRFLFTGRWLDVIYDNSEGYDLKLQYNRTRHYDPEHGRWLQRDPLGYVDGAGLYEFLGSAPSIRMDPYGLAWSNYDFALHYFTWQSPVRPGIPTSAVDLGAVGRGKDYKNHPAIQQAVRSMSNALRIEAQAEAEVAASGLDCACGADSDYAFYYHTGGRRQTISRSSFVRITYPGVVRPVSDEFVRFWFVDWTFSIGGHQLRQDYYCRIGAVCDYAGAIWSYSCMTEYTMSDRFTDPLDFVNVFGAPYDFGSPYRITYNFPGSRLGDSGSLE
jgi:RHS repeat-associated protein